MIDNIENNSKIIIGLVDADLLAKGTRHPNLALLKNLNKHSPILSFADSRHIVFLPQSFCIIDSCETSDFIVTFYHFIRDAAWRNIDAYGLIVRIAYKISCTAESALLF